MTVFGISFKVIIFRKMPKNQITVNTDSGVERANPSKGIFRFISFKNIFIGTL